MPVREAPARLLAACRASFAPHALRLTGNILMGAMFYSLIYMLIGEESSPSCSSWRDWRRALPLPCPFLPCVALPAAAGVLVCAWSGLASSADGTPGHICPGV